MAEHHVWMQLQEGKRAMSEVVSVTTSKTVTPAETFKAAVVVILAVAICIVAVGFAERAEQGGDWRWSIRLWLEQTGEVFSEFPKVETGMDALLWSVKVIAWVVLLLETIFTNGWVQGEFDGSVGALPVTRPVVNTEVQP